MEIHTQQQAPGRRDVAAVGGTTYATPFNVRTDTAAVQKP